MQTRSLLSFPCFFFLVSGSFGCSAAGNGAEDAAQGDEALAYVSSSLGCEYDGKTFAQGQVGPEPHFECGPAGWVACDWTKTTLPASYLRAKTGDVVAGNVCETSGWTRATPDAGTSGGACIAATDAAHVQTLISHAPASSTLEFCESPVLEGHSVSLDDLAPHVTIKGLHLADGNLTMTSRSTTSYLTLDGVSVTNGTSSRSLSGCSSVYSSGTGIASVILYGSHNTLTRSTIRGGTASGVFVEGDHNVVSYSTFEGVNTWNASDGFKTYDMTSCSGAYVSGYHTTVEYNDFDGCNGTCIHVQPYSSSHPGDALVWGNSVKHALQASFAGTIYHDDAGAIYSGYVDGHGTVVAYNTITGTHAPPGAYQAGLYFDNYTANFVAHHNYIDDVTSIKLNPDLANHALQCQNGACAPESGHRTVYDNVYTGAVVLTMGHLTSPDAPAPGTNNNVKVTWVSGTAPSGIPAAPTFAN